MTLLCATDFVKVVQSCPLVVQFVDFWMSQHSPACSSLPTDGKNYSSLDCYQSAVSFLASWPHFHSIEVLHLS